MAKKSALILTGGVEIHRPREQADIFATALRDEGFEVRSESDLDFLLDAGELAKLDLIVPNWTGGQLSNPQLDGFTTAVGHGVGLAGCHGGMCDGFRGRETPAQPGYMYMTGGQWVLHPGGPEVDYVVRIADHDHYITRGAADFAINSEHYYLLIDPANTVLATTRFPIPGADGPHSANGPVDMPVLWTKRYGLGRVFYCAIGHKPADLLVPAVRSLWLRGFLWAAHAENALVGA